MLVLFTEKSKLRNTKNKTCWECKNSKIKKIDEKVNPHFLRSLNEDQNTLILRFI